MVEHLTVSEPLDNERAVEIIEHKIVEVEGNLRAMLHEYDVVDVTYDPINGSHVVLAERPNGAVRNSNTGFPEMGFVDPSPFTAWTRQEHVPELRDRQGLRTYYDMVRSDGSVRGALRILKTPIQGAEWYIEPASSSVIDQNIAKFVSDNLFEDLDSTWESIIENCLRMIDYGYFPFEKVYDWDGNRIKLIRLTPIHPLDVQGWNYASNGRLTSLTMEPLTGIDMRREPVEIPYSKLLLFVFEMEGYDLRGTSVLRSAYKHFFYKDVLYKLDAIQKERHGIGVPCIKLPSGFTKADRDLANELGRNLRTNERAFVTAPANWEISFLKLEGQPVDPVPSIEHHDKKIYENILATFMGTRETTKETLDTFYKSTRYIARGSIASVFNKFCIKELVDINFLRKGGYPKLRVRRMGETEDFRTLTFAVRNLIGARALTPDKPMEDLFRKELGFPELDEETAREQSLVPAGQNVGPPEVGPPKQQAGPPVGVPSGNAGTDRTGGS